MCINGVKLNKRQDEIIKYENKEIKQNKKKCSVLDETTEIFT